MPTYRRLTNDNFNKDEQVIEMRIRYATVMAMCVAVVLLGGCGPSGGTTPSASAERVDQVYRWKLITTWPKNLPGLGTAPERLAEKLRVMSRGRLDIKVYGSGELVGPFEVFDAVSQGTAEMGHGAAYYWRGKLPVAAMFATVPFGMNAQEMNGWLAYGGGMELWRELYQPFGLVPFAAGNSGVQMAGWFNKEINSLADLKGVKMRIPGLGGEVLVVTHDSHQVTMLRDQAGVVEAGVRKSLAHAGCVGHADAELFADLVKPCREPGDEGPVGLPVLCRKVLIVEIDSVKAEGAAFLKVGFDGFTGFFPGGNVFRRSADQGVDLQPEPLALGDKFPVRVSKQAHRAQQLLVRLELLQALLAVVVEPGMEFRLGPQAAAEGGRQGQDGSQGIEEEPLDSHFDHSGVVHAPLPAFNL